MVARVSLYRAGSFISLPTVPSPFWMLSVSVLTRANGAAHVIIERCRRASASRGCLLGVQGGDQLMGFVNDADALSVELIVREQLADGALAALNWSMMVSEFLENSVSAASVRVALLEHIVEFASIRAVDFGAGLNGLALLALLDVDVLGAQQILGAMRPANPPASTSR